MTLKEYKNILIQVSINMREDGYGKVDMDMFRDTAMLILGTYHPEIEDFLHKIHGVRKDIVDIVARDLYNATLGVTKNGRI